MIHDEMIHGGFATSAPACRNRSPGRIERETPLVPQVIAEGVWDEACEWLGTRLPVSWIRHLTNRAEVLYLRNPRFRCRLQEPGDRGRDWLWAFNRHWLAALIHQKRPNLFQRLPGSFSNGTALRRNTSGSCGS
jgi:hypothetical protein